METLTSLETLRTAKSYEPHNNKLDANKTGLILGSFLGAWHAAWSLIVAAGLAMALLDGILWLHFLNNPFEVAPFSLMRAAFLVAVTFSVGYIVGWILAHVWNVFYDRRHWWRLIR